MSDRGSYFFDPIDHDREWSWLTFLQVIVKWSAIIAFAKIPNNANHSFANYPNSHYFDGFLFWEWKKPCKFIKMIGNCVIHWEIFQKKVRKFLKKKIINYFFLPFCLYLWSKNDRRSFMNDHRSYLLLEQNEWSWLIFFQDQRSWSWVIVAHEKNDRRKLWSEQSWAVSENSKLPFDIHIEFEIFKIGP